MRRATLSSQGNTKGSSPEANDQTVPKMLSEDYVLGLTSEKAIMFPESFFSSQPFTVRDCLDPRSCLSAYTNTNKRQNVVMETTASSLSECCAALRLSALGSF